MCFDLGEGVEWVFACYAMRPRVHAHGIIYELAYAYQPTAHGDVTAVLIQWHKHRAA